ncbi:hypothetical protein Z945_2725 [Sulfitobacter noctilucae]|uniref:DUF1127 domain-containing protein n=1 Tax=Sulfitobacter noctilucae TaxID=1342302 RepID=UPI00056CF3F5|nr:DUF1127 domain-containing protein [Sulfitobacter noctilucae]KIN61732.1 hypothetical protein Z945_2725 [Sulfitobacter noctilucae]
MSSALKITHRHIGQSRPSLSVLLLSMHANWRSRRQLAQLDAHLRDDIGVTDSQAEQEAGRPVWDVPAHWLQ